jgi:hypothetical protein
VATFDILAYVITESRRYLRHSNTLQDIQGKTTMKKMIVLLAVLSMTLSSCVIVDRGHCPPGQAKKGRC